jgi:hypothetical protein
MSEADDYDHFMGYDEPDDGEEICPRCMGSCTVDCHCGGDLCLCENQGDAPCPTCHGEGFVSHERAERYFERQREFAAVWERIMNQAATSGENISENAEPQSEANPVESR